MSEISQIINQRMSDLNLRPVDVVNASGVSKSSLSQWMSGENTPSAKKLPQLAKGLYLEPEHLLSYSEFLKVPKVKNWKLKIKTIDDSVIDSTTDQSVNSEYKESMVELNMYTAKAGCSDDETYIPDTIDHDTKVGVIIADKTWARHNLAPDITSLDNIALVTAKGNSMEPLYSSGDILFVDTGYTVLDHQNVYMFRYDGQIMIKTLQPRGREIWVYAENKKLASSAPWSIDPTRDFAILGKVAGKSGMESF
ncbi:MAG: XRE family transcriptional regulator [Pseudomonadota bacterium]|nr:XRE family transcriptional regulator [Pseudomonadota bacterium]